MSNKHEAAQCPACLDVLWPRHEHDLHCCSCGSIAVDGGPHLRTLYEGVRPKRCYVLVDAIEPGIIKHNEPIDPGATYAVIEGQLVFDVRPRDL